MAIKTDPNERLDQRLEETAQTLPFDEFLNMTAGTIGRTVSTKLEASTVGR